MSCVETLSEVEVDFSDGLKTHAPNEPPEGSLSLSAHSSNRFLLTCASALVTVLIHLRSGGNSFSRSKEGFARNASMLPQRNMILFRVMGLSSIFSSRVTQRRFSTRLFRRFVSIWSTTCSLVGLGPRNAVATMAWTRTDAISIYPCTILGFPNVQKLSYLRGRFPSRG